MWSKILSALIAVLCMSQCVRAEKCGDNWEQVITEMIGKLRLEYETLMSSLKIEERKLDIELQEAAQNLEFSEVSKLIINVQNFIDTLAAGCANAHDLKCIEQANSTLSTIPGKVQTAQEKCSQSQAISEAQKIRLQYMQELTDLLPKIGGTAEKCIDKKPKCIIDCVATELSILRQEMFNLQSNIRNVYQDIRKHLEAQNRCVKQNSQALQFETDAIKDSLTICLDNK